jgi:hypothetical protein
VIGKKMAKVFWYMMDTYGGDKTIAFIKTVRHSLIHT